jgi:hypothetical protein
LSYGKRGSLPRPEERHFDESHFLVEEANSEARAAQLDPYAMKWLFTDNDFSDTDMDAFLEGLPGYIYSHFTTKDLSEVLTASYFLRRIKEHLLTCATATELSEQARVKRVSACVNSLGVILHRTRKSADSERTENPDQDESLRVYMQSIVVGELLEPQPPPGRFFPHPGKVGHSPYTPY